MQVYDLEKKGGSIIAGVLKLMQERKANPPPPRDARLPPKPAGQTVGSFRAGLQMLPEAIARNLQQHIRSVCLHNISCTDRGGSAVVACAYRTYQLVLVLFRPALYVWYAPNMAMHGC